MSSVDSNRSDKRKPLGASFFEKAKLVLADGSTFEGFSFGAEKSQAGEVVFATGMVGYDLSLTDPSYASQILTFTYPLIGNWGVPPKEYWESAKIHVAGVIISDLTTNPSHWQSQKTLDTWLKEQNIPGIFGIDTRALTQKLREQGAMLGKIVKNNHDVDFYDPNSENLVAKVSPKKLQVWRPENGWQEWKGSRQRAGAKDSIDTVQLRALAGGKTTDRTRSPKIGLLNCGAKENIKRNLLARGATVYELPWDHDPFENNLPLNGLVISNGPGDPKMAKESIAIIKKSLDLKLPTFGICLGNQLLALSAGGDTYKLKFGHRAQNQPTIDVSTDRCFITTQNHGFSVDEKRLPRGFRRWFYNANDNTNEGIIHEKLPFFSVQFHPEATPGPFDTDWLFDYFFERLDENHSHSTSLSLSSTEKRVARLERLPSARSLYMDHLRNMEGALKTSTEGRESHDRTRIKKVLLLGSGALQIGQAGEFDYSGSQAIKALKEEGIDVILINPNIATIQTSKDFATKVYFTPIQPHFVKKVAEKEKPDGILLSFGGQTALNCGLELSKSGFLKKHNIQVLGSPVEAIQKTEDRHLFAQMLKGIDLDIPESRAANTSNQARRAAKAIGYPVIVRAAFSLGGQDSGVAYTKGELDQIVNRSLAKSSQVLIEEYLTGWKEIEYEVVRDKFDNCITVCNMENVDPMGIHTGESIVVAPSQTLNNFEYHKLREIAIKVIRHLGIVGECNIQFALNPRPKVGGRSGRVSDSAQSLYGPLEEHGENIKRRALTGRKRLTGPAFGYLDYRIIEVNARLSRSSALASKATGYPLAYVAAKLALGYSLTELKNSVTQKTIACFEPALDYLVVKFPRWDLSKFQRSQLEIGSSMQSVGEVMAIGRKFEEAIQKSIRMLDIGLEGILDEKVLHVDYKTPTPWRLFAIAQAIYKNVPIKKIAKVTGIDPFFLAKVKNICDFEKSAATIGGSSDTILAAKQLGTSDKRLAKLVGSTENGIRALRHKLKVTPSVKQIDTLAAEYPAVTNYLYLTYNGDTDDINSKIENYDHRKVIVLGSGPYRIGSSVEFDWCSVNCAQTARDLGFLPIIINCNPETVSTDFDMAERLYFEELTTETVLAIYEKEKAAGIIVSMGGQTPNNLVLSLAKHGAKILGTSPTAIDIAEDRNKFSNLCDQLGIDQPPWANLKDARMAVQFAEKIGFPVLVRPSYVLSGAAMNVAFNSKDLGKYLSLASHVSQKYPVVISKFIDNAKEIELDAAAFEGKILTSAICEHVENAGVHSGDSTMVLPPQKIYRQTEKQIEKIAAKIAASLAITGPFNIQFLAKDNKVMVIECNLRASRSLPFVSKVTGVNFVKVATQAILSSKQPPTYEANNLSYVGVKAPQFSFSRIKGADPILRVEMSSTGEVASFGADVHEAFLKSLMATGLSLPKKSVFISLAGDENKAKFLASARLLANLGLSIFATAGTSKFLKSNGIKNKMLYKIYERKKPNVLDFLLAKKVDLVINIVDPYYKQIIDDDYLIRRATIDYGIPLLTNLQTAELFASAITQKSLTDLKTLAWDNYVKHRN